MSATDARDVSTPAGVAAGEHRPAQLGRRVGAYVIDGAIALLLQSAVAGILAGVSLATEGAFPLWAASAGAFVALAAWFVVYTLMQGGAGSVGMRALGLRLVRAGDGSRLGFVTALVRNIVWWLGGVIVVGLFSPLFDGSVWHRGWHDRASGTVMTDISGRGPVVALPGLTGASAGASAAAESLGEAATDASHPSAAQGRVASASVPTVLPAAPILPRGEDTDLVGWTPGGSAAEHRAAATAGGVISFVPGITDPERYDAPVPERAPGPPVVDAPPAPAVDPAPAAVPAAAPAAVPVAGGATATSASFAVPGATGVIDDPLEQTRLSTGERPVARLVWDDGARQALYGRTLFGRNPAPETGAMVSPVRDETLSLSKTHFELVPGDDRSLWVIDRHSTNGVVIRRGAQSEAVVPGERTRVRMGDVLEFGDRRLTIEVAL